MDADDESQISKDGIDNNNNLLSSGAFNADATSLMIVASLDGQDPKAMRRVATTLNALQLNG